MGWGIGFDDRWQRDIGYGVPAYCDAPGCTAEIHRGLAYVCGAQQPYGGDNGCGLYFCCDHLIYHTFRGGDSGVFCSRCATHKPPYKPKAEHPKWTHHKATDPSWAEWRAVQAAVTHKRRTHHMSNIAPNDKLQKLFGTLSTIITSQVQPLFAAPTMVTLIVRDPACTDGNGHFLLSNEADIELAVQAIRDCDAKTKPENVYSEHTAKPTPTKDM